MKRALAVIVALVLFLGAVPFSMASDATADPEKKFPELQMTEQQKKQDDLAKDPDAGSQERDHQTKCG